MDKKIDELRDFIADRLELRGHCRDFSDDQSLFDSGVLDSLSAVTLLMELEGKFGIKLDGADFDFMMIDTFAQVRALVLGQ